MPKSSNEPSELDKLDPVSKALKKTVEQLWSIFVRRYVARGLAELFSAAVVAWLTTIKLWSDHWIWWLAIPFPIVIILCIDAIQLLVNPHYYAMNDISDFVKKHQKEEKVEVYPRPRY